MLSLAAATRIFLCREPVDFRKAHDGLCTIVRDGFGDDPFAGDVFAFYNKARDRIKLLVWDRNGFWLSYKRLERGTFPVDVSGCGARIEISRAQLAMLLEGIDGRSVKISSHYTPSVDIMHRGIADGAHARSSS
jgi:transposase